jgi:vacuolar-type H+-ATPase subunit H
MKNVLERFEKLAAAHQLNADCAAALRGLLADAHTAGYSAHMAVSEATDDDENAMPDRSAEPDTDEEEATERMVKAVRKAVRKELRKATHSQKKSVRKQVRRAVLELPQMAAGMTALQAALEQGERQ